MTGRHRGPAINPAGEVLLQVRIPRELMRQIDHFAIDRDLFRAGAVEALLQAGLQAMDAKLDHG